MIVEMSPEAINWMKSKGNQVIIKTLNINACCAPGIQELVALPSKPKNLDQYVQVTSGEVVLYIHKMVNKKQKIILTLSGPPFLKSLFVTFQ